MRVLIIVLGGQKIPFDTVTYQTAEDMLVTQPSYVASQVT